MANIHTSTSDVKKTNNRSAAEKITVVNLSIGEEQQPAYMVTDVKAIQGTLPANKGGTGISDALVGGRVIASSIDGQSLEETTLDMAKFNGLRRNIQNQLDSGYSEHDQYIGNIDELRGIDTSGVYMIDPMNTLTIGHMPFTEPFLLSVISAGNMGVQTAYAETSGYVKNRIVKANDDNLSWTSWVDFGISPNIQLRSYRIDITPEGWTEISGGGWYKDIVIDGILEKDNPTVGLIPQGANATEVQLEREAFCCVGRIDTFDGVVRVFCFDKIVTTTICVGIQCNGT